MNGDDLDGAAPQVIISSYEDAAAWVRLHDRRLLGEYETTFAVALHADGLDARIGEVSVSPWDGGALPGFLDGLAADFRGWAGTRSWAAGHLKLTAAFHSGGHVELGWAIRPGNSGPAGKLASPRGSRAGSRCPNWPLPSGPSCPRRNPRSYGTAIAASFAMSI